MFPISEPDRIYENFCELWAPTEPIALLQETVGEEISLRGQLLFFRSR